MKLRLLLEAERDLEIGADFYESQNTGLGTYFNDCLASDIESLNCTLASTKSTEVSFVHCRNDSRSHRHLFATSI
jgi:hypothetical protein